MAARYATGCDEVKCSARSAISPEERDRAKRSGLRAAKMLATGAFALAAVVYVLAKAFESGRPALSYVAAFAEAAMVGALADWFAVVALFRYPLGIPFPHTAVLRRNKERIADNLGDFIQNKFLATEHILQVIREFDPAHKVASWLSRPDNAGKAGDYSVRAMIFAMHSLDDKRIQEFVRNFIATQFKAMDLARPGGRLLEILTEGRRYQPMLDAALERIHRMLSHDSVKEKMMQAILSEIPGKMLLERSGLDKRASRYILEKLLSALENLIGEIKQDPDHPLRIQVDHAIADFAGKLKNDPAWHARIRQFQHEIAEHAEVANYFQGLWAALRAWLSADLGEQDSLIRRKIVALAASLGQRLQADKDTQAWINDQVLRAAPPVIEEYRSRIGNFIAQQVKSWRDEKFIEDIELNIGKDLQYIRLNGTLVGGLAGLLLFTLTQLIARM